MAIFKKKKKGVAQDDEFIIRDIDEFEDINNTGEEDEEYEEAPNEEYEEESEELQEEKEDDNKKNRKNRKGAGAVSVSKRVASGQGKSAKDETEDEYEDLEEELDELEAEDEYEYEDDEDDEDEYEDDEYDEFEDDIEEDEQTQEEKALKKKKRKKKALTVFAVLIGIILLVYLGGAVFFSNHFYYDTTINGWNGSLKSVSAVEDHLKQEVDGYVLTMNEIDGTKEMVKGSDISLAYKEDGTVSKVVKTQNPFLWPKAFFEKPVVEAKVGVDYDEAKLTSLLSNLDCMKESKQTNPKNAVPEFNGTQYVVKKEELGSKIDKEGMNHAVKTAINGFVETLDMEKSGCYSLPKYTAESPEVKAACDKMNEYIKASITLDFSPDTVVVNAATISGWLKVNKKMEVTFTKSAVKKYVQELAKKYDTVGTKRTFTTPGGKKASVSGGTYGWELDQDKEYKKLVAEIKAGKVETRKPNYSQTAATHDEADWGTTYVDVDKSKQHMWYVVDGAVKFEADVVTGLPTPKKVTPSGVYDILERAQNKTLRGEKRPDGSYEYETPVAYWMRVTWTGVGFHTATWQPYFGGSLYKTNGSHGCINMSYAASQKLYGIIKVGVPVIIHD